jgi:hypothetical protein
MIGKEIKTAKMEKLIKKLKLKYPKGFVVDIKKFESGLDG